MGGLNWTTTFVSKTDGTRRETARPARGDHPNLVARVSAKSEIPRGIKIQRQRINGEEVVSLRAGIVQYDPVFITVNAGGIHALPRNASRFQHARRREVRRRKRRRSFHRCDMAIRAETAVNSRITHIEKFQRL